MIGQGARPSPATARSCLWQCWFSRLSDRSEPREDRRNPMPLVTVCVF